MVRTKDITVDRIRHSGAFEQFKIQKYSWPGLYPQYAATWDSGALCHACCTEPSNPITVHEKRPDNGDDPCWAVAAIEVNWGSDDLWCDHCGGKIESAYGERI